MATSIMTLPIELKLFGWFNQLINRGNLSLLADEIVGMDPLSKNYGVRIQ